MKEISVYDSDTKELGKLQIDFAIEKKDVKSATYSQAVKVLRQNWRQGTVACKGRSDVSFSNKKPWKQKGTGRARAGSKRSPLWRKGGVIFGPQARTRELFINRKQIKSVLNNIFYNVLESENGLYCLDFNLKQNRPKTKIAFEALKNMGIKDKKVILFLPFGDELNLASFKNIANVSVFYFDQANAFDLSNGDCWVFLKKDEKLFKDMVSSWN